jgi:hypothetical protein
MSSTTADSIAGVVIPDTPLVRAITAHIRDAEEDLLFNHSRRVFLFGALQGRRRGLQPNLELLYAGAMLGIALHTTPGVPEFLAPETALVTAGVETDVLGIGRDDLPPEALAAVTAAHPRPNFKQQILAAFNDGMKHRPETTFGTCNADVLERFDPTFVRDNFVDNILNNTWPE